MPSFDLANYGYHGDIVSHFVMIFLRRNNEAIDDAVFRQKSTAAAGHRPQSELHLAADKDTRYQRLAEIIGAARTAGLNNLGIVALPGGSHESARQSR